MEREKRTVDVKPLLLKIIVPLAFPLAGFIISIFINKSRTSDKDQEEEEMASPDCVSQHEYEDEESSHSLDGPLSHDEADAEELEQLNKLQTSGTLEIATTHCVVESKEISIKDIQEGPCLEEEIESLRSMIAVLEEKACNFELQVHDYCCMKEQESAFQKLQIMCLGLKLESLEAQSQRLEDTITELRVATEEFDDMRAGYKMLQRKFKKLFKLNKHNSHVICQQMLNLEAREVESSRRNAELERAMEEVKDLVKNLHEERKTTNERIEMREPIHQHTSKNKEVITEEYNIRRPSSNKELICQLAQLRDQWTADMEEMIYLGWTAACLRHELLTNQEEQTLELPRDKGDQLIVEVSVNDKAQHCNVEFHDSESPSLTGDVREHCKDITVANGYRGLTKPRLFHKLKGWANGKGKSKRSCLRDKIN
ncbi:protein CHUP1, chloroplastic-like isoform X1 [Typha latifolia]|uniref:protein CHUP1, chloroplastic-like isoform X1 n=2 Tax=Typha latifolia TaxID=4733 RepID=UPI003C30B711